MLSDLDSFEQSDTRQDMCTVVVALFGGVRDDWQFPTIGPQQVERDFIDLALQPKHRRDMRFVGNAPAEAQQRVNRLAHERRAVRCEPTGKRGVDPQDATVGRQ